MESITDAGPGARAGAREWWGLAVLALPTLLLSLDLSVMYLALPRLSDDLDATGTQQLWITDIYGFLIAGFLVTMGTLGDRIGRRRLLMIGAVAFTAASLMAAYSGSAEMLIVSRALMGLAGATLMPSTLALISSMFTDPKQMGVAISVWMSCFMGGMAVGPVVGGLLLGSFWWGSVFLLAVPVMVLLLIAGPKVLPEHKDPNAGKLDFLSVVLSLGTVLPVIYGLKELAVTGWETMSVVSIAAGLVLGVVFVLRQNKLAHPLLDLRLFGNRAFSAALAVFILGGVSSGSYLLINLYLQTVEGLSPLNAGLWLLPSVTATIIGIMFAPAIATKIRPAYAIAGGMLITAVGYFLVSQIDPGTGLGILITGLVLAAFGAGPMAALTTGLVMGSAPMEKMGSASSVSETSGELGIALGVATIGSVGAAVYTGAVSVPAGTPPEAAAVASESIVGVAAAAEQLPAALGAQLLDAARDAFTAALGTAALVSASLAVLIAVLSIVALRHVPPTGSAEAAWNGGGDDDTAEGGGVETPAGEEKETKPIPVD